MPPTLWKQYTSGFLNSQEGDRFFARACSESAGAPGWPERHLAAVSGPFVDDASGPSVGVARA